METGDTHALPLCHIMSLRISSLHVLWVMFDLPAPNRLSNNLTFFLFFLCSFGPCFASLKQQRQTPPSFIPGVEVSYMDHMVSFNLVKDWVIHVKYINEFYVSWRESSTNLLFFYPGLGPTLFSPSKNQKKKKGLFNWFDSSWTSLPWRMTY